MIALVLHVVAPEEIGVLDVFGRATEEVGNYEGGGKAQEAVGLVVGKVPVVEVGLEDFVLGRVDDVVGFCDASF